MIRVYLIGVFILVVAILANFVASKLQLITWYDFLKGLTTSSNYWDGIRIKDGLWLFVAYPFILGLSALVGELFCTKILNL